MSLPFTDSVVHMKRKVTQDVSLSRICDLCQRKGDNRIEVKFFELPSEIKDVLSPLHKVQESLTFQELWLKYGKKAQTCIKNGEAAQKRDLSINVVDSVWKPAYKEWSQLVGRVIDGTLPLDGVDKFFGSYKDKEKDLIPELERIFNLGDGQMGIYTSQLEATPAQRASEIDQYRELRRYASAANIIWELKETLGLSGDFSIVTDLRNKVSIVISLLHIVGVFFPALSLRIMLNFTDASA